MCASECLFSFFDCLCRSGFREQHQANQRLSGRIYAVHAPLSATAVAFYGFKSMSLVYFLWIRARFTAVFLFLPICIYLQAECSNIHEKALTVSLPFFFFFLALWVIGHPTLTVASVESADFVSLLCTFSPVFSCLHFFCRRLSFKRCAQERFKACARFFHLEYADLVSTFFSSLGGCEFFCFCVFKSF